MRFILVGASASGKNHLQRKMQLQGAKVGVSFTTRPPRDGEVEGSDYYYITKDTFLQMERNGELYEKVEYNDNFYGLTKEEFKNCDVVIMNAHGVGCITKEDREDSFVIYIDIPHEIRVRRMINRGWDEETIKQRMADDIAEFSGFTDYDLKITNPNF
jgi:guanylate kinase